VMKRFLQRDLDQLRRSWYVLFFQLPWIPETMLKMGDWRNMVNMTRGTSKIGSFINEDIVKYKEAWSQPGAMTSMLNWYRAVVRYQSLVPDEPRVKVPTLMMWGVKDFALTHRMARPSMDYVDEGNLLLFPEATHWVHLDAAEEVNHYLLDFILDKASQIAIK
jgi:pimeloyl-ACP methyl ester carboxylesterase